ncbi:uncharacterized protein I303_107947 [Kwoniella dejecticola CBS 10117]|uniref:Uncharacterized protein n=1 Tax=Kwoniella dejecticola CBS 10117 TaxID=1296121 RepID=A0AAJ8MKS1_9TREE
MVESTFSRPIPFSTSTNAYTTNRKRTASTSEKKNPLNGRRTPSGSNHNHLERGHSGKHNRASPAEDGATLKQVKEQGSSDPSKESGGGKAPSLNVDIRNSLILPSLSQRFSVLLPSLSTAPEESLRSLLASQRARHHGPALTEEEEELLFAEMRDQALDDQWDGRPPNMDENWARTGLDVSPSHVKATRNGISPSVSSPSLLTSSSSTPSFFASSENGKGSHLPSTPASLLGSPPPTSSSFSSFQTFGVGSSPDTATSPIGGAFKTKSYGFSGGSGMREAEYMRKVKKSFSHKDLKNSSISSRRSDKTEDGSTPTRESIPLPPPISPEKANAYYQPTKRPESPTTSEKTATPTSSIMPNISSTSLPRGHSRSSSLNYNPPTPTSAEDPAYAIRQQKSRKRQSRLDGLTPAQVKRISMALQEIGGQLKRGSMTVGPLDAPKQSPVTEEVEEILDSESRRESQIDEDGLIGRDRRPSDLRSEDSCQSATSSVFPFQMSPTNSTFTGTGTSTEPSSPSRLPPSPRTHNLLAHVEEPLPPIPMPVFTPTRSQPVRHQPTSSNASTSTVSPNQPVYIPGQPRPIRLTHHSQSSISSRAATPSNQSPLDAIRTAISPENTPSPLKGMPGIAARTSSLGRSRSVNQAQGTPTRPGSTTDDSGSHSSRTSSSARRRAGTIGEAPSSRRMSSTYSSTPSTPDIIEEADETAFVDEDHLPHHQEEEIIPEVKQVQGRHSVANSRSISEHSLHQLHHNLGWGLDSSQESRGRTISSQGSIDGSDYTPPNEFIDPSGPISPTTTLRRPTSTHSTSSSTFEQDQIPDEIVWANSFVNHSPKTIDLESDETSNLEPGYEAEILRKMSGIGMEDLMMLQAKLVVKAKAEREALRGDLEDSPMVPFSPPISPDTYPMNGRATLPIERATSPVLARPISPPPPSSWRFPPSETLQSSSTNTTPSQERSNVISSVDTHILTPPLTGSSTGATVSRSGSKSNQMILPSRPAPAPPQIPADTPSDMADEIKTPSSAGLSLSRNPSTKAYQHRVPLEQDPDVRRDFEARIAAATAALNRTPSVQNTSSGSKLDRKFSKKGGPMVISSPKLVSSTANVPTTPLTPENFIDPGLAKNLEKSTSGGSKMSLKWKKFTGKRNKGPSFSGNEVTPFPPAQPTPQPQHKLSPSKQLQQQQQQQVLLQQQQQNKLSPIQDNISLSGGQGGLQRSASASVAQRLEEPINLRSGEHSEAPPSAPPNLGAFRFPPPPERTTPIPKDQVPSPPSSLGHASGLKHVMSKMKRSKETSPPPRPPHSGQSALPQLAKSRPSSPAAIQDRVMSPLPGIEAVATSRSGHTPTSSDDDARTKFIEAGRALGLTEDQLNDMLAAKGMKGTSAAAAVPVISSNVASSTAPALVNHEIHEAKPEEKKGLFRSLSKARKAPQPSPVPSSATLEPSAPIETAPPLPKNDRVVVRRTMILPEGLNIIPSTPQTLSTTPKIPESPDSASLSLKPGNQPRKQSIRRKPLQLSKEDHELVSGSPPAHRRNFSFSNASIESGSNTPTNLGFSTNTSNGSSASNSQNQVPTLHSAHPVQELNGLGFLHPNTPLHKTSSGNLRSSPGNDSILSGDDESHTRSSTGGSLIDMYRNNDEEEMLESPTKKGSSAYNEEEGHSRRISEDVGSLGRPSMEDVNRRRMTQAVEITEYADGQVIWNIVDALRTSVTGSVDGEEYTFDSTAAPHSRSGSYSSSVRHSIIPENGDVFQSAGNSAAGWPKALGNGTAGLNFRHRDRNIGPRPRPPTDVYFTSHRDVADLIDHLSQDLNASHGRIDILPHSAADDGTNDWPPSNTSPFGFQGSAAPSTPERSTRRTSMARSMNSQFEDAPSPAQFPIRPTPSSRARAHIPSPIKAQRAESDYSQMENLSPPRADGHEGSAQRQLFNEDNTESRGQSYVSTHPQLSPSSKSFASSVSAQGRSVEDRLQALLDRLKGDGIGTRL